MKLNQEVREYWEQEPCGTSPRIVGDVSQGSDEWFRKIENYRYEVEPFIHSVAQFTRYHGKKVLEIGVGAGTDHLQWARAGAQCHGVDLTDAAIETTRTPLTRYGLHSQLQRIDAEILPFEENTFDVIYSWGVIHHSEYPEKIISEIQRVLKPGGHFIGMMYGRHSLAVLKLWLKEALFSGKPWRSFRNVLWYHMESVGTKAYTVTELNRLFSSFSNFTAQPIITPYDKRWFPAWLNQFFPNRWGWFISLKATK